MAREIMDVLELLRKRVMDGDVDFLRQALELVSNLVETPSRQFNSSGGDCLLSTHWQFG